MHKLCLLLAVPGTFFGESAESIASGNPVTASRSDDTTSNSPIRLQSQGSPVGMTASTTHRSVGSKDWIAPSSNHKGERTEERAMGMDALVKLYNYVNDLKLNQDTYLYRKLEEWFKRPVHPTDVAENLSLARPEVSPKVLDAWLRRSDAEVFKQLISIYNIDSDDSKHNVISMFNKLAESVSSAPGVAALNWMANELKALKLPPVEVADMLGLQGVVLCVLHHSAAAWIRFVDLLHEENSDLAIPVKEAWSMLIGDMDMEQKHRFLLLVWPDLPASLNARVRQAGSMWDW
uniref:RxLR effector candidate protein n=1 Tax=Peronospora matthiolae TaxID=2874970 RepID=A0AAV1VFD2_9STRA